MDQTLLAAYLKTTTEQLVRFNPGLSAFVTPSEVVVVPSAFYMEEGMTAVVGTVLVRPVER